jgi:predicted permease
MLTDLRYACRLFATAPGWTAVAVLSLALGIGANLLVFSIVDAVLLRPFPYRAPSRLVFVWGSKSDAVRRGISGPDLDDWRRQNRSFVDLDAFLAQVPLSIGDSGDSVIGACIGPSVLSILGVAPARGRAFTADDSTGSGQPVAIVSDAFWRGRMAGAETAVGSRVLLNGRSHEIVGVMPPGFFFPDTNAAVLTPVPCGAANYLQRGNPVMHAIGRLREGVSVIQAERDLDAINRRLAETYPETNREMAAGIQPLRDIVVGKYERSLWVMLAAVAVLLLIACANVAHLQLARGVDRQVELAIRAAAGADRRRLFQQLVTESLLLALLATAAGFAGVAAGIRVIRSLSLTDIVRIDSASVDMRLLAIGAAVCILVTVAAGVWPAWKTAGVRISETLKTGVGGTGGGARRHLRELLATIEIALATVLLIGAGLLITSFVRLSAARWGFESQNLWAMSVMTPPDAAVSRAAHAAWTESVRTRLGAVPGVRAAASADGIPIEYSWRPSPLRIDGRIVRAAGWTVSHGYFSTLGTRVLDGREFSERDDASGQPVAVVSEAFARRMWRGKSAVGRQFQVLTLRTVNGKLAPDIEARIRRGDRSMNNDPSVLEVAGGTTWTVVGVVEDIRAFGLNIVPEPAYYLEYRQVPDQWSLLRRQRFVVRTEGSPSGLAASLKSAVLSVDGHAELRSIRSMAELVAQSIGGRGSARLLMLVSTMFGSIALLLTASGMFGMLLHTVNQRLPELGVRLALGATRANIISLILGYGLRMAVTGMALGLTLAWAGSRSLRSLVFEIAPTDASTWSLAIGVLFAAVLIACAVPIRRAATADPSALLRS